MTADTIIHNAQTIQRMAANGFFDEEDRKYLYDLAKSIEVERQQQILDAQLGAQVLGSQDEVMEFHV